MLQLDLKSRKSIYEQVMDQLKEQIMTGQMATGEKLPWVRELSKSITVNPNTVQKAFHILEEEHLMESRTGAKSCMTLPPDILDALRREVLSDELCTMARTLRQLGISKEEALRLIEQAWEEEAQ